MEPRSSGGVSHLTRVGQEEKPGVVAGLPGASGHTVEQKGEPLLRRSLCQSTTLPSSLSSPVPVMSLQPPGPQSWATDIDEATGLSWVPGWCCPAPLHRAVALLQEVALGTRESCCVA